MRRGVLAGFAVFLGLGVIAPFPLRAFESLPAARFEFDGPIGERLQANLEQWLLLAPQVNPGMLEMFRLRDRQPAPQLVPWAGEFIGKYLIAAVQGLSLTDDPRLRRQVAQRVAEFIATQAEEGYLGPFPKADRLLKHWDLWGHYHAILALLLWHEHSGDAAALAAARKAADLVCAIYLDSGRRVGDAGDPEMNMAILTGLARLYRVSGEPRYLRMVREVEKDWERAGDYLRTALAGREFFRTPRPRWESLHSLQGLVELWRITGDQRYREAFEHHWRSLRRWDRRNTGGFSSGEQATGNPYAVTAIETCCTVAWMAMTVDYLRLTEDSRAADDLELATLNAGIGAQHSSGRWWTYSTPMDGIREASAHAIVFQARAGTPELNCCSVNGPRVLGMLSEWAVMTATNGLVINWLGAGHFIVPLATGVQVSIDSSREGWREGTAEWRLSASAPSEFTLRIRIPAWAINPQVLLNDSRIAPVVAGTYQAIRRRWGSADRLVLKFDLPLRAVAGAQEATGKVSLYRGPILLAYDQAYNAFDEAAIPQIDLNRLGEGQVEVVAPASLTNRLRPPPWLVVTLPVAQGGGIRLVDFANAGAGGTRYRSWLPVKTALPPPAMTLSPPDMARVPLGPWRFGWQGSRIHGATYRVEFATNDTFSAGSIWSTNTTETRAVIDPRAWLRGRNQGEGRLWWRVVTLVAGAETTPEVPPAWFQIDTSLPPQPLPREPITGVRGELMIHSLRNSQPPELGELRLAQFSTRGSEGTTLNGRDQKLVYALTAWPEEDFTVSVSVRIQQMPERHLGQVFSAWTSSMDDPLRLAIEGGKLFARVEAGAGYSTPGVGIEVGRWYVLAAVKRGAVLSLYLDGEPAGSCAVPLYTNTQAQDFALGGNPHYGGNEFLAATFADLRMFNRALDPEEIRTLTPSKQP